MRSFYSSEAVEELELQLERSLRPVDPSPEFVNHLHTRLTTTAGMVLEPRQSMGMGLLLAASSLIVGLLMVWLLRQFRGPSLG